MSISLHNKKFKAAQNSENGEVSEETIFHYRQQGDIIWATYEGGDVYFGTLSGRIQADKLFFQYQHQNRQGEYVNGECHTEIKLIAGRVELHETWQWKCRDFSSGTSVLVERD